MHRTLTLAATLLLPLVVGPFTWVHASESQAVEWIHQFGTTGGSTDLAQAVAVDGSGNVYVAGQVFGALPGETSAGGGDAFVRKYDDGGNLVWTRQFGTSGNDTAFAVLVSGSAVYVGGNVQGALPGHSFAGGAADAFLRRYDANGSAVWTDQFGSPAAEAVRSIAVDMSVTPTAVYVTGTSVGALPGQTSKGSNDAFVRKYDDGTPTVAWTRQFGTAAVDIGLGITLDTTGVYVVGRTDADLDGAGPETHSGNLDAFIEKFDPSGSVLWTHQFGTSAGDVAFGVGAYGGEVYVVGRTDADLDGAGSGTHAGNQDAFVRMYDAGGNVMWTRQFGTPALDNALAVSADAAGVHVGGRTDGNLAGPGTFAGVGDAFVQTYDTNGSLVLTLTRQFGSPAFDQALGIAGDGSVIYVVGQADGALPGETQENAGNTDAFLRKYDASWNDVWTHRFGTLGPVADFARAVARGVDGSVYVAGDTRGTLPGQTSAGLNDAFVRKYDRDGNEVWTRQFGSALNDFALALAVDARGRVYVAGRSDAAQPGQTFAGGLSDAYIRSFDSDGNDVWTRQFGTGAFDNVNAAAVDHRGAVYVAGQTNGTLPGQSPIGGISEAFIRKYTAEGAQLWTRQFGSMTVDIAFGLTSDARGDVCVTGQTFGTFPGQTSAGGVSDAFVRKYNGQGEELWTRQFGSSQIDLANAVSAAPTGDVYVAGQVGRTLPDQISAGGLNDAFVRKYDQDGNEVWTRQFGTSLGDSARALSVDAVGRAYVAGEVTGTLPGQVSAGFADAFVRKYDPDGSVLWTTQFGSSQRDSIGGVSVHESGEVVVAGDTDGALPGQMSAGDVDTFVVTIVEVHQP